MTGRRGSPTQPLPPLRVTKMSANLFPSPLLQGLSPPPSNLRRPGQHTEVSGAHIGLCSGAWKDTYEGPTCPLSSEERVSLFFSNWSGDFCGAVIWGWTIYTTEGYSDISSLFPASTSSTKLAGAPSWVCSWFHGLSLLPLSHPGRHPQRHDSSKGNSSSPSG